MSQLEPLFLKVPDAAAMAGVNRTKLYDLMRAGDIAYVKVGRSRRVPVASVRAWAAQIVAEQNPDHAA